MRVLGLIPARGGSKEVPRKNIRSLCGKPLLQYTVEAAQAAKKLTRTILSTDDMDIAEIGYRCRVEVPFIRPAELARDETPMLPVVQHAVSCLEARGEYYDAVCLLQPTNPLRRPEDIDACIELLQESGADAVVTLLPVPFEHHPHWVYFRDETNMLHLASGANDPVSRRQDLLPAFHREGSIYVTRRRIVMEKDSLYGKRLAGYLMNSSSCVNIDRPEDWSKAESLLTELV